MQKIITKDGSVTFKSNKYDETYHSVSGAEEEAIKKFVEPCNIKELAKKSTIKILDVCFGLGYNSAAAIDAIRKENKDCKIIIFGLENDEKILENINELQTKFSNYNIIREAAKYNSYNEGNIEITLLIGDARETIQNINEGDFDLIFLDPFSTKKCPELWTEDFIKNISKLAKKGAYLTTYSCAAFVRRNLQSAGFNVFDGPAVGRRAPSTIAIKQ